MRRIDSQAHSNVALLKGMPRLRFSRKKVALALAIVAGGGALFAGWTMWRASRALGEATEKVSSASVIRFTVKPLTPIVPAGLEHVAAPAVFTDAAFFQGKLFLAGPAGLDEFADDGALRARYRVGIELPPAPLVAMSAGFAGDSRSPELWIATAGEGLIAFDGRGFRQVRAVDARFRKLTAILSTETGRVILGTEKAGVLVYDGREMKPFHASLADLHITTLAGDDTDLWAGTIDRGLHHFKAGALEVIDEALPDRRVLSLARDGETVFAGTAMGVAEIRAGTFTRVIAPGYFAQALAAGGGKLHIGTLEEGMVEAQLDARLGSTARSARLSAAAICKGCSIRRILRTDTDVLALAEDSLWRGNQAVLNRADSILLADRNISALSLDRDGRLWIGYFDRGLEIIPAGGGRGRRFEDDHLFCINRIVQDSSRGVSAVATANGLVLFDASSERRRVVTRNDGLIANQVTDVALRPDGTIVAATPAGVSFIDASGISSVYAFHGLVNNHAYALASDGPRTLVGTLGGLSVLDGPLVRASYTTSNSALKHNWITAIARAGDTWFVGTYGAGVLQLDSAGRWQSFEELRGVEINANAMAATPAAIYAGTLDRGLAIYSRSSGRWNFWTAGLPSLNVTAVESRGAVVYIGTDNGLVKLPETTVLP